MRAAIIDGKSAQGFSRHQAKSAALLWADRSRSYHLVQALADLFRAADLFVLPKGRRHMAGPWLSRRGCFDPPRHGIALANQQWPRIVVRIVKNQCSCRKAGGHRHKATPGSNWLHR
jgi:hypothetical protein